MAAAAVATSTTFRSVDVLPADHATQPASITIPLSDYDQLMTGNHTTPCCVFAFTGDREALTEQLRAGLQNVIRCIPLLGGRLLNDAKGRLSVTRTSAEPVPLGVARYDDDTSIPSYAELAADGFTPSFFSTQAARLTPPDQQLAGLRRDDGCPVAAFQASFIRGGVILAVALHHTCGDAHSIDHVYRLWADSTRAAAQGQTPPVWRPDLDRTAFNADAHATQLSTDETEQLRRRVKGYVCTPVVEGGAGPALPPMPEVRIGVYHVSSATCAALKAACAPIATTGADGVPFVSSYDVLAALSWRCATRARLPLTKLDAATVTVGFGHGVDTRGRFDGAPPEEYFGNAFSMTPVDDLPLAQLLGADGVARAAQAMRRSIRAVGPRSIRDPLDLRQALAGREDVQWGFLPENTIFTSWAIMKPMQTYDFGFGLPAAMRLPVAPYAGVGGVLPAARAPDGSCDGYDLFMVLEVESDARLRTDPEWLKYVTPL